MANEMRSWALEIASAGSDRQWIVLASAQIETRLLHLTAASLGTKTESAERIFQTHIHRVRFARKAGLIAEDVALLLTGLTEERNRAAHRPEQYVLADDIEKSLVGIAAQTPLRELAANAFGREMRQISDTKRRQLDLTFAAQALVALLEETHQQLIDLNFTISAAMPEPSDLSKVLGRPDLYKRIGQRLHG